MTETLEQTRDADEMSEYVLDDHIGYLLRLANQRHTTIFHIKRILNLTPVQFAVLIRLSEIGPCSQNFLGRQVAMDVATIKGVVNRLQKKGLTELKPDPSDKRQLIVSLAPDQEHLVPDLHATGHRISRETLKPLTAAEQKTLLRLLKKML